jgi:hypothetical protein
VGAKIRDRIACTMRHVVVQEEKHARRGRGGSGAKGWRRLAHRAARAVRAAWSGRAALVPTAEVVLTSTLLVTGAAQRVAPNILSIAQWQRLLGGKLYAPLSRVA